MKILRRLYKPSPFKAGCLVSLAAVLLYYFAVTGGGSKEFKNIINTLDWRISDSMFRIRGEQKEKLTGNVVIVVVDEQSLEKPEADGLGQWPWPRTYMASILRNISSDGAKVIGLDFVYSEEDRTSPEKFIPFLKKSLSSELLSSVVEKIEGREDIDNDRIFADALEETPTILGYFFEKEEDNLKSGDEHARISTEYSILIGNYKQEYRRFLRILEKGYRPELNLELFRDSCLSSGFFNPTPDIDGIVRRVPLLMRFAPEAQKSASMVDGVDLYEKYRDGVVYPSLSLEMLREGLDVPPEKMEIAFTPHGIYGLFLDNRFVLTDPVCRVMVNYRGGPNTFPYISATKVLRGEFEKGFFKDKYVLIGPTAAGLFDVRSTPFSQIFPGVEVHANLIDNVIKGDYFKYDVQKEAIFVMGLTLVGGILLSLVLAKGGPMFGGLTGILFISGIMVGNYYFFFLRNQYVGTVFPLLTYIVVFITVTMFNYLTEGRQRKFIHGAFGRYVSPDVVNELMRSPEKLSLGGEKRVLTVFFSDIRGFTSISEKMDAAEMSNFLNEYLTAMSDIVMETGGMVDKFIGDAVVAIWGAPLDDDEHAVHAAESALLMMDKLRELQIEWNARGLPEINIGIGINTGAVSVGNMGSRNRFDYTVIGDNVNLASRLEGINKAYGTNIIISESTREAIGSGFTSQPIDLVRVKGKQKPVMIHELLCKGEPSPELRRRVEAFCKARTLFLDRKFDEAGKIMEELDKECPRVLYKEYLDRVRFYRNNPPRDDWDGVFTFTTK
ncbi:MAG: adenylate/guanylate cyclase domain-containing protein [Planctomycetes bacterium]|nr:adenylate/guanylate cyclase domain-containing protein [Planctomycetota bacterium]